MDDLTAMMYSDLLSRLKAHISRAEVLKIRARDSAHMCTDGEGAHCDEAAVDSD